VRRGFVQIHPQTADRFGFGPGDTILLNQNGTAWPFRAERLAGIERGHARLNNAEMDVIGICPGIVLAAHRAPQPAALPHNWPVEHNRHDWLVPKELT
jgi:anaerobic selenocysteine-containing dehydrogenase